MSSTPVAAAMAGAQVGSARLALATRMVRMNADAQGAIAQVIDAAAQNAQRLAAGSPGVGQNMDISV